MKKRDKENIDFYEYEIKYAVPSYYDLYKCGGSTLRDDTRGMQRMLHYFPKHFTEAQLQANMQRYNLKNMLAIVKDYFQKEYGYAGERIELNNRYQRTVNSYIYNDEKNPAVVHIDELFESTMISFFLAMFKWSKDFENLEVYGNCYLYVLFLMNDVSILGEMQDENANRVMLEMVAGDLQILQLAEDCYWTVLCFCLAHEVAHAYLASIGRKYTEQHPEKEEFDADEIAYHIVLKFIMDQGARGIVLEPYTYLAPMMYMDFFDMVYYTDRILYRTFLYNRTHPTLKKRKGWLFKIVDRDEYQFDTREGNYLYRGFNQVYQEYKSQTIMKMEKGKLTRIIRAEQRKILKELMKENDKDDQTAGDGV